MNLEIEGHEYLQFIPEPWKSTNQIPIEWFEDNFKKYIFSTNHVVENCVPYELNDGPNKGGVYFLIRGRIVVYVGQSNDICRRLIQHYKSDKSFTHYWCFGGIPEIFVEAVEGYYIHKIKPPLNNKMPPLHEVVAPYFYDFLSIK